MSCGFFDKLSDEILEQIFARVPVTGLLKAGQVCKKWCSFIRSMEFDVFYNKSSLRKGWFFQFCVNFSCPTKNNCYGFNPETQEWHLVTSRCVQGKAFPGSPEGTLCLNFTMNDLCYKREFLSNVWEMAPSMHNARTSPLLGVVEDSTHSSDSHQLIVAGGVSDSVENKRAVEIFTSSSKSWEVCQSLPIEFQQNCSRHWMTCAVASGKFFISEIYTGAISALDLTTKLWSPVRYLWPPGALQFHLLSCNGSLLVAAACCEKEIFTFRLWKVNESSLAFVVEIGRMPSNLCSIFFGPGEDGLVRRGEGLQCVVCGDLVYIFYPVLRRDYSRENQVVLCDLTNGNAIWTLLPPLLQDYHHGVGFCSPVKLRSLMCKLNERT